MASTFAGLAIAARGLYASQTGLLVTGNNISNVNTAGYSRQVVNQSAASPAAVYAGKGVIGGGVQVNAVDRVRNIRLDEKYWQENTDLGEWQTKADTLTELEELLTSTTDGYSEIMNDFYEALESLANNAGDTSVRTAVRSAGEELCGYLNNAAAELRQLQQDCNTDVVTTVTRINAYSQQIADLNEQIRLAGASGADTNTLEDQRALLVDKLSSLVSITVDQSADNAAAFTISTAGGVLVSGNTANLLETYQNTDGLYDVRWQDTGDAFTPAGGSLKAYLDLRDGTGIDGGYQGIPYYTAQLNEFARTLAAAFNEGIYADGADYGNGHADGYGTNGQTGIRFFSYDKTSSADLQALLDGGATMDEVYSKITAANISLSSDIYDDVGHIAAASAAGEEANNEIVNSLISMLQDNKMFNKGTPEDFMNSLVATLGTNSASAQRMADNQATIVKRVGDRRTSVSGVSTNEETANLTIYEQAYEASSQVVSVWNEVYAVTINLISD